MSKRRDAAEALTYQNIIDGIKTLYRKKIRPLEEAYKFELFHSAPLTDTDIEAKPLVLIMGQYSTGKTSFIKFLLDRDYPGAHIGPEPTTDRFVAVMNGASDKVIPGNAACVAMDMPFSGLNKFGTSFMSKFQAWCCVMRHVLMCCAVGVASTRWVSGECDDYRYARCAFGREAAHRARL